ncbi:MAG: hypothetical protein A49_28360 [Methyloceanibacter sp.]|nr:MAG: hypothetical protein A49_28360 [Methyloceanibacter sp.]
MTHEKQIALLTTVNAPYRTYMDGSALAAAISIGDFTTGQVNSFFTEAKACDQLAFARHFGVSEDVLTKTASAFADWSGQKTDLAR